ncbi:YaiI/YqxD family protein [bacterium]|nr:YaiI/YqxD family protein [bacterium]
MKLWIDADACPREVKEIVLRASKRLRLEVCLVSNSRLSMKCSELVSCVRVSKGFDETDDFILQQVEAGDIVITADIPLAARIIDKQGLAIDPRGELYDRSNVKERLAFRDLYQELREGGVHLSGPAPFRSVDKKKFAATLDRLLTHLLRSV